MKNSLTASLKIIFFGLRLPFFVWLKSKKKLNQYESSKFNEQLDDEYIVTSWLNWIVDSIIFLIYPLGILLILSILTISGKLSVLFAFIPLYFSTLFISYIRELGGSLMLLHMNVRNIEKNIKK